jgi:hypothetical protein
MSLIADHALPAMAWLSNERLMSGLVACKRIHGLCHSALLKRTVVAAHGADLGGSSGYSIWRNLMLLLRKQ